MKILTPTERTSERLIRQMTASILNIPECEQDPMEKTAAEIAPPASGGKSCPQCQGPIQVNGAMERCSGCGYAQATAASAVRKTAKELSVEEYYRKIFPDDYANELTKEPKTTKKEKVQYGSVPVDKKVTARQLLGANDVIVNVSVPDADPTPSTGAGSGGKENPDPNVWNVEDSANSVSGPQKNQEHGTGEKSPGEVKAPDVTTAQKWLSREVVAQFCPSCADEMKARGIKRISAAFLARQIAANAEAKGFKRQ